MSSVFVTNSIADTDLIPDTDEVPECHAYLIQRSLLWLIVCWSFRTALNTGIVGVVQWIAFQNIASLGYMIRNVFNNKFKILPP